MAKLIMTAEEAQRIALAQLVAKTNSRKLPGDRKKGGK